MLRPKEERTKLSLKSEKVPHKETLEVEISQPGKEKEH